VKAMVLSMKRGLSDLEPTEEEVAVTKSNEGQALF